MFPHAGKSRLRLHRIVGASGSEYALTAGLIAVVSLGALATFGPMVGNMFDRSDSALAEAIETGRSGGSGPATGGPGDEGPGGAPGDGSGSGSDDDVPPPAPLAVRFALPMLTSADLGGVGFEISGAVTGAPYEFALDSAEGTALSGAGTVSDSTFTLGPIDLLGLRPGRIELTFASISAETGELAEAIAGVDYVELGQFDPVTGLSPLEEATSGAILAEGFSDPVPAFVSGEAELILNDEVVPGGTGVVDGDLIALRALAPEGFETSRTLSIAVGPLARDWQMTTRAPSFDPTNFVDFVLAVREPGERVESNAQSLEGIEIEAPISISGDGMPEYRLNDLTGGWTEWTAESGTIAPGGVVQVRMTADETFGATRRATVTIGDVVRAWDLRTRDPRVEPANFEAFPDAIDIDPRTEVVSEPQTIDGMETPAGIEISGTVGGVAAEYAIGDGDWTSAPGMIAPGETVRVRMTTGGLFSNSYTVNLTIGGIRQPFTAVTRDPVIAPTGFVDFDQAVQDPGAAVLSSVQPIFGLEAGTTISVTGDGEPEYRINDLVGGWTEWTSEPSILSPGGEVQLKTSASTAFSEVRRVEVTVGGITRSWEVRTRDARTVPDRFVAFRQADDLERGAIIVSNAQSISGMEAPADISISGIVAGRPGEYSINGGPWTSEGGKIANGDSVRVRMTTGGLFSETYTIHLTIGGVRQPFAATTRAAIVVPSDFRDFDIAVRDPGERVESIAQPIKGLEAAASIIVSGDGNPEYRINDMVTGWSAWTNEAGSVPPGSEVQVLLTASEAFSDTRRAQVTIGGITRSWEVRTRAASVTPGEFPAFTSLDKQERSTVVESNEVVIGSLEATGPIKVTGLTGEYRVNGGQWTDASGSIENGDRVQVRLTTGGNFETAYSVTLTIGNAQRVFVATTRAAITAPANFEHFVSQSDRQLSSLYNSNIQDLTGHEVAVPVSISGVGEYRVNNGSWSDWTTQPGEIQPRGRIQVRITTGNDFSTPHVARVTVGGVTRTFTVTTRAPDVTPDNMVNFTTLFERQPNQWVRSPEYQILTGFEADAPISIRNGEYRTLLPGADPAVEANWSTWTASDGSIAPGSGVWVRVRTAPTPQENTEASLTVGTRSVTFRAKTGSF